MEKGIDWSDAPEGATHYNTKNNRWYKFTRSSAEVWVDCVNRWTGSLFHHVGSDVLPFFTARDTPLAVGAVNLDDMQQHHKWSESEKVKHDEVNNPAHYDIFDGQQAIDIIRKALTPEEFAGYCKGNFLKYRLRAGEKGDATKCLAKSNWYRDYLRGLDNE